MISIKTIYTEPESREIYLPLPIDTKDNGNWIQYVIS